MKAKIEHQGTIGRLEDTIAEEEPNQKDITSLLAQLEGGCATLLDRHVQLVRGTKFKLGEPRHKDWFEI